MRVPREACPQCGSRWYKKNGHIHTGKQNHRCNVCGRAFVLTPENSLSTEEQRCSLQRVKPSLIFQSWPYLLDYREAFACSRILSLLDIVSTSRSS
jgi:hypothetical protein